MTLTTHREELDAADRWKIMVVRGWTQGIRSFSVWVRDTGLYSGGETEGRWFDLTGDVRALELRDDPATCALLKELVEDDWNGVGLVSCSPRTRQLGIELLHRNGIAVDTEVVARLERQLAEAQEEGKGEQA